MKTKTAKIISLSAALLLIVVLTSAFKASDTKSQNSSKYLTMRTIEVINGIWDSKIVIFTEDGKMEEIELEKFRSRNFTDNSKKIHDAINAIAAKGYTMVSSSSGNGDALIITSYIFVKQ